MRRLSVIYDVEGLIPGAPGFLGRGGIFVTAVELLKVFARDPRIHVSLCGKMPPSRIEAFARDLGLPEGCCTVHRNRAWMMLLLGRLAWDKAARARARGRWRNWFRALLKWYGCAMACRVLGVTPEKALAGVDLWFSPVFGPHPLVCPLKGIRKCTMLHDTIPLMAGIPQHDECQPRSDHWHARLVRSLNADDRYFANSEHTKRDFLRLVPQLDADHIRVTPLACSDAFVPSKRDMRPLFAKYRIPPGRRYVFCLCTIDPRKNLIRATRVFVDFIRKHRIDDLILVLGGGAFETFIDSFNREVEAHGAWADRIVRAGYIDDADLPAFYSQAEWLVYTSQYEGFGLPALEAMACGCPVVTSNAASLPEVVGDAAIMVDWDSDEQHLQAYEACHFDPALREQMARKGLARAKQFSWQRCADAMVETMVEICEPS